MHVDSRQVVSNSFSRGGIVDRERFNSIYWGLKHVITLTIAAVI